MSTLYKPSQWRGKRLTYKSIDPDEPKRETKNIIVFVVVGIALIALFGVLINLVG
jgi:hypothetical protein